MVCFSGKILFQTVFSYLLLDWFLVLTAHSVYVWVSALQPYRFTFAGSLSLSSVPLSHLTSRSSEVSEQRGLPAVQPETGELRVSTVEREREKATLGLGTGQGQYPVGGEGGPAQSLLSSHRVK